MQTMWLAGLVKIVLPSRTVRLCDGGFIWFTESDGIEYLYESSDPEFGVVTSLQRSGDGADQAPGGKLMLEVPTVEAQRALLSQAFQNSRLFAWQVEVNPETSRATGHSNTLIVAQLDRGIATDGKGKRTAEIEFVSCSERLMVTNEGNSLNGTFHKRLWPGEKGFDNAIGMGVTKAWGVAAPPRGVSSGGGYASGGGINERMAMV